MSQQRKMLAARVDLADKISDIAARRGTLYDYVNDILGQAIRAESLGLTLTDVLDDMWLVKTAKDAGFTITPEKIIYEMAENSYIKDEQKTKLLWYEIGHWYGRYYEDLGKFEDSISKFFWDISEFKLATESGQVIVTCLSSKFSEAYTELFSKFIEGGLNALGYNLNESEVSKGIIKLRFDKSKGKQ